MERNAPWNSYLKACSLNLNKPNLLLLISLCCFIHVYDEQWRIDEIQRPEKHVHEIMNELGLDLTVSCKSKYDRDNQT